MTRVRLGTRRSPLALVQSELVASKLRRLGVEVDLVEIVTEGDQRPKDAPIAEGVFVAALEGALRSRDIDLAVHSAKDVPLDVDPNLPLVAFPERGDPRDALVTRNGEQSFAELPFGARVGTDSPRRTAFAHAVRPDLRVFPLMGNVDARITRLDAGEAEALILAAAGLDRLGLSHRIAARLDAQRMPPAPAQGALVVQARRDDRDVRAALRLIDNPEVRVQVLAERAVLKAFGGGYTAPLGALAEPAGRTSLKVIAGAATADGLRCYVLTAVMPLDDLASGTYVHARGLHQRLPLPTRIVLDTRPEPDLQLAARLERQGFRTVHVPTLAIARTSDSTEMDHARRTLSRYDWVVLTSKRGVHALFDGLSGRAPARVRWAAVGDTTARALSERGIKVDAQPKVAVGEAIPAAMAEVAALHGARILLPRSDAADGSLPNELRRRGAHVDDIAAYQSIPGPVASANPLREALLNPDLEAVIFASGSAVRGFCELAGDALPRARGLKVLTIGPKCSAAALDAGFGVTAEALTPDGVGLSAALARGLKEEVRAWLESQIGS